MKKSLQAVSNDCPIFALLYPKRKGKAFKFKIYLVCTIRGFLKRIFRRALMTD